MREPTLKPLSKQDLTILKGLVSQYGACSVAKGLANATWDSWQVAFSRDTFVDVPVRTTDNHYYALANGIEKAIADVLPQPPARGHGS